MLPYLSMPGKFASLPISAAPAAILRIFFLLVLCSGARAQVQVPSADDSPETGTAGRITVGGFVDTYYGYDFSRPADKNRPYFVSANRHNEFTVNLAFVDLQYTSERVRARFVPGIGTYMAANYAAEPPMFRNLVEGNVGVKLFRNREVWLDAGVLGSPYTNEGPVSFDQLMYTRSFAPEYVPYYLSGARLSVPLGRQLTAYLYLLNGWQNIQETNAAKSLGTQLEYRPFDNLLVNWNTYLGNERNQANPLDPNRMRYFSDVYVLYNMDGKFSGTACVYLGAQNRRRDSNPTTTQTAYWQNLNLIGRYRFTSVFSVSGRLEYFRDPGSVQICIV
jgi:hypothetical protein